MNDFYPDIDRALDRESWSHLLVAKSAVVHHLLEMLLLSRRSRRLCQSYQYLRLARLL